ncbi:MAG: hypothetical protein FLDDKLPJ_00957 [Phycisphaerae bacterium]|nr:hypothetical protein [Phycisphaerae bacterium]
MERVPAPTGVRSASAKPRLISWALVTSWRTRNVNVPGVAPAFAVAVRTSGLELLEENTSKKAVLLNRALEFLIASRRALSSRNAVLRASS